MSAAVHLDVTELLRTPVLTGIQRVEHELIRHWPERANLIPVISSRCGFLRLPRSVLDDLAEGRRPGRARRLVSLLTPLRVEPGRLRLLNPELFLDPVRARCYLDLLGAGARAVGWIIYDFLPWLMPQHFAPGAARSGMPYLQALAQVPHVAHISAQTREDYERRIMHGGGRPGPVISLGADGLQVPRQQFSPARRRYLVLGTIERRKNLAVVLEAFAQLWAEGCNAELVVIGLLRPGCDQETLWMDRFAGEPRFRYLGHADDAALGAALAGTRALIFASESEGFGLPPWEALHLGIPVIVAPSIPSVRMLPPAGQMRLGRVDATAVAAAVRQVEDDAVAARLWSEAASLEHRTWQTFAAEVAAWVSGWEA